VFVDAHLKPLRQGILSSDQRAEAWVRRDARRRQTAYAGQTGSLLRWFRAEEPAVARDLAHVLMWKDFVRAHLTGVVATEPTDAGAAGWLDPTSRSMRAQDPAIPPLRESLASAGEVTAAAERLTGIRAGTPVFMGCIDCEAAAIGSGITGDGELSLVAGTWSINQTFVDRMPRRRGHFLVNPSAQPGRWLVLEGSPTSAANLDWAVRVFGGGDTARALRLVERTPRTRALFVPRVPTGLGSWIGIDAGHGRGELLRAVIEGVVFGHRVHVEQLRGRGRAPRRVRLAGGIARSSFGAQLFADVLGCAVEVPAGEEIGALGAALCAGVGAGVWPSLRVAQSEAVRVARTFRARADAHAALSRDFARFLPLWSRSLP
jgi:L-xylulokinase